jgi:tRNA pseudouridine32 synthase/23S rRNA pseudouridine746 synthase
MAREQPDDRTPPSRWQLPPGPWPTLLDGLCARFAQIPRAVWLERFARGRVQDAAGSPLPPGMAYRVGLEVRYFREVAQELTVPFAEHVLHADAHLVVADKPHFLPVTPGGAHVRETLLARLVQRLGNPALVPLHRLDRDTAGLVLLSACAATLDAYQSLFRTRRIDKGYEAIAPARPALSFPLRHSSRLQPGEPFFRMREVEGEPNSETHIDVLERGEIWWRYALQPVTGRKHQLRVHLAGLGAPIRHDPLYPDLLPRAAGDYTRPLQLLARHLSFVDPLSGEPRRFESRQRLELPTAQDA